MLKCLSEKHIVFLLWFVSAAIIMRGVKTQDNNANNKVIEASSTYQPPLFNNNETMLVYGTMSPISISSLGKLSRGKRYVAFPEGSSFSCAICMTTGVIGNPNVNYLSMGLNWGVAYNLPNITWVLNQAHGWDLSKNKTVADAQIKRRHRRELYGQLETLLSRKSITNLTVEMLSTQQHEAQISTSAIFMSNRNSNNSNNNDNRHGWTNVRQTNNKQSKQKQHKQQQIALEQHATNATSINDLLGTTKDQQTTTLMTLMEDTNPSKTSMATAATIAATCEGMQSNSNNESLNSLKEMEREEECGKQKEASSSLTTLQHKWRGILSRPKRYLSFPEGSSFSVAVCFTVGIIGNPRFNYMSFGLNWGVAYDLPNTTWVLNHLNGFATHPVPPSALRRRTRRALFNDIETIIDNMGYNGRGCILRTLCESRQYFQRHKMNMIGEMLRIIFSLPKERIYTRELHESKDLPEYDRAFRKARSTDCERQYDCHFSLLALALGKYSNPTATNYYGRMPSGTGGNAMR